MLIFLIPSILPQYNLLWSVWLVMISHHTKYSITHVVFRIVYFDLSILFLGVKIFRSRSDRIYGICIFMFLYQFTHYPGNYVLEFETFVIINLWYGTCAYVQFNIRSFLFRIIFNTCTSCNFITSAKIVTGLRIVVKGYFSNSVIMTSCIASPTRLLK